MTVLYVRHKHAQIDASFVLEYSTTDNYLKYLNLQTIFAISLS